MRRIVRRNNRLHPKSGVHCASLLVLVSFLGAACSGRSTPSALPPSTIQPTQTPANTIGPVTPNVVDLATPTPTPQPRTLTICQGAEPDTLFIYGSAMLAQRQVLEAIYDGPVDHAGFAYQPVILEKLPSLSAGDAIIEPVSVGQGDRVVDDRGEVVTLKPGVVVRPFGCNAPDCAVAWDGSPLQMAQLSAEFTLLDGLKWSDGVPLTSADSVFSFTFLKSCPPEQCYTNEMYTVQRTASYTALDERSVRWAGLPGFLDPNYQINFLHPLPQHIKIQEHLSNAEMFEHPAFREKPLGWGPYVLEEWEYGVGFTLHKNSEYHRASEDLPRFDRLVYKFMWPNADTLLMALKSGSCDLIEWEAASKAFEFEGLIPQLQEMDARGELHLHVSIGTVWEHLDFSIGHADYDDGYQPGHDRLDFFGDRRTRQGFAYCIDRQRIVDEVFYGLSQVPDSYVPGDHPLFNSDIPRYDFDPQAGAALLEAVGWIDHDADPATPRMAQGVDGVPDGTPLSVHFVTTDSTQRRQVIPIIKESLAECGVDLLDSTFPAEEFFADAPEGDVLSRRFDLAEFAWMTGIQPPCDLFLSENIPGDPELLNPDGSPRFPKGWQGQNNPGFSNPQFDQACRLARIALPGQPEYAANHRLAQQIFAEQLPVLPLFYRLRLTVSRPDLCGYSPDASTGSDTWQIEEFDIGANCLE